MTTFADQPLEEQIAQWRAYLRRRQAIHGPDVEELEGHLRDQLTALTEAGLTGDEAFLVAVKRMGSLDALSREFARAHSERLWKQLVIAPDADAPAEHLTRAKSSSSWALPSPRRWPSRCRRCSVIRLSPDEEVPLVLLPQRQPVRLAAARPSTSSGSAGAGCYERPLARAALRGRGCVRQRLSLPRRGQRHAEMLTALHLPIALWLVVGVAYVRGRWFADGGRMNFVRFSGELVDLLRAHRARRVRPDRLYGHDVHEPSG